MLSFFHVGEKYRDSYDIEHVVPFFDGELAIALQDTKRYYLQSAHLQKQAPSRAIQQYRSLHHPLVLPFDEVYTEDRSLVFIRPFYPIRPLSDVISTQKVDEDQVVEWCKQLLQLEASLKSKPMPMYLLLDPRNIGLTDEGELKVFFCGLEQITALQPILDWGTFLYCLVSGQYLEEPLNNLPSQLSVSKPMVRLIQKSLNNRSTDAVLSHIETYEKKKHGKGLFTRLFGREKPISQPEQGGVSPARPSTLPPSPVSSSETGDEPTKPTPRDLEEQRRREQDQLEQIRLEYERRQQEALERQRQEFERRQQELLEKQRLEFERMEEMLRKQQEEFERRKRELEAKERLEQEREHQERERLERERLERERQERERLERERLNREHQERERLEREHQERERKEKERQERIRQELERLKQQRLEWERKERERLERERLEFEQKEKELREKIQQEFAKQQKELLEQQAKESEFRQQESINKKRKELENQKERHPKESIFSGRPHGKASLLDPQTAERQQREQERLQNEKEEKQRLLKERLERESKEHAQLAKQFEEYMKQMYKNKEK